MSSLKDKSLVKPILLKNGKEGNLLLPGNIFLAPLAGWTDAAFRSICLEWGAFFTYTEMVSAEACFRENKKTLDLLARAENEKLLGVQIFTSEPKAAAAALAIINQYNPTLIDLNCGCSIPKILRSGAGAVLMQDPAKIKQLIKTMKESTAAPVTVKLRSGWDHQSINFLKTAEAAIEAGASLLTLHPRTRAQGFSGQADWTHLKALKEFSTVPVIGSGDLFTAIDVKEMLTTTGCDGVMLARGTMGNPFIFQELQDDRDNMDNKVLITPEVRLTTALKQLKLDIQFKGERLACKEMRKHFCAYSKGIPGSASFRNKVVYAASVPEYESCIHGFIEHEVKNREGGRLS